MAKNTGNVPKKQWAKWSPASQAMFNRTRSVMRDKNTILPDCVLTQKQWDVIRWSTAWLVADMASDMSITR